jgi:hypothetical protein
MPRLFSDLPIRASVDCCPLFSPYAIAQIDMAEPSRALRVASLKPTGGGVIEGAAGAKLDPAKGSA